MRQRDPWGGSRLMLNAFRDRRGSRPSPTKQKDQKSKRFSLPSGGVSTHKTKITTRPVGSLCPIPGEALPNVVFGPGILTGKANPAVEVPCQ